MCVCVRALCMRICTQQLCNAHTVRHTVRVYPHVLEVKRLTTNNYSLIVNR